MMTRIILVVIFNFLFTVTFGYAALRINYPKPEHYERLYGIFTTQALPSSLAGSVVGLLVAERVVRKQSEVNQLRRIAKRRLKNPNLTHDELNAWSTIAASLPEDEP